MGLTWLVVLAGGRGEDGGVGDGGVGFSHSERGGGSKLAKAMMGSQELSDGGVKSFGDAIQGGSTE